MSMSLKRAIDGYLYDRSADLSKDTIHGYTWWLNKFLIFCEERHGAGLMVQAVTRDDTTEFTHSLRERELKPYSRKNAHVALAAFFNWAKGEFKIESPMTGIKAPRIPEVAIEPYSVADLKAMLQACEKTKPWSRTWKTEILSNRPSAARDKAIILALLDTGLRASELCDLRIGDVEMTSGAVFVKKGKGGKSRHSYIGDDAKKQIWKYLAQRFPDKDPRAEEPLFITRDKQPFNRAALKKLITRIGQSAGVKKPGVHRFRHTFAIMYLRAGGDPLTLQRLMGHSDMGMTKRYVAFVSADLEERHRLASPVRFVLKSK